MNGRNWLTEAFGAAVTDIRAHVVEEAWFGRPLSKPNVERHDAAHDLGWAIERQPPLAHEPGVDFDR